MDSSQWGVPLPDSKECKCFIEAVFVSTEAVDSNLSIIDTGLYNEIMGTSQIRFVPKLSHVTGMTTSSTLLVSTDPLCIIGIKHGKTHLAS